MNLSTGIIFCFLILGVSSQGWGTFLREAGQGKDQRMEANYKDSDKYFHSQGTIMLPKEDQGAPGLLNDARENIQRLTDPLLKGTTSGQGREDSRADQFANEWGRSVLPKGPTDKSNPSKK
uniref:Uncharacterized protein n=1 Tax=Capra hircus TaxID=9925 RepID=A0A8C2P472_CAPHI